MKNWSEQRAAHRLVHYPACLSKSRTLTVRCGTWSKCWVKSESLTTVFLFARCASHARSSSEVCKWWRWNVSRKMMVICTGKILALIQTSSSVTKRTKFRLHRSLSQRRKRRQPLWFWSLKMYITLHKWTMWPGRITKRRQAEVISESTTSEWLTWHEKWSSIRVVRTKKAVTLIYLSQTKESWCTVVQAVGELEL